MLMQLNSWCWLDYTDSPQKNLLRMYIKPIVSQIPCIDIFI